MKSPLFRLPSAARRDAAVEAWFLAPDRELRRIVQPWFEVMQGCGPDVCVLLHDGCPTACVEDSAFGYANAFNAHANVGFFFGAELDDPNGLLEGAGKRMRHVKVRWRAPVDEAALAALIKRAYEDMRVRLAADQTS